MAGILRVLAGKDAGRTFALTEGQPLLVGRDMGTNTRLKDPHVAMLHCQVLAAKGKVVLSDRGSSGGTFVNGQRVTEHDLQPGDVIRIGDTRLRFDLGGTPQISG